MPLGWLQMTSLINLELHCNDWSNNQVFCRAEIVLQLLQNGAVMSLWAMFDRLVGTVYNASAGYVSWPTYHESCRI
jgi:hypothetical protein